MQDRLRQQLIRDLRLILLSAVLALVLLVLAPHAQAVEPHSTALDAAQTELEGSVLDARERSVEEGNARFAALVEGASIRRVMPKCVVPHANGMPLGDRTLH